MFLEKSLQGQYFLSYHVKTIKTSRYNCQLFSNDAQIPGTDVQIRILVNPIADLTKHTA